MHLFRSVWHLVSPVNNVALSIVVRCMYVESGGRGGWVSWRTYVPNPPPPALQAHKQTFDRIIRHILPNELKMQSRQMTRPWHVQE